MDNLAYSKGLIRHVLAQFDMGHSKDVIAREIMLINRIERKQEALDFVNRCLYERHLKIRK